MRLVRLFVLDERGEPEESRDVRAWARWYCHANTEVANDLVRGVQILTGFAGMAETQPPLLWETRINGGERDGTRCLYSTREKAQAGHREIVFQIMLSGRRQAVPS